MLENEEMRKEVEIILSSGGTYVPRGKWDLHLGRRLKSRAQGSVPLGTIYRMASPPEKSHHRCRRHHHLFLPSMEQTWQMDHGSKPVYNWKEKNEKKKKARRTTTTKLLCSVGTFRMHCTSRDKKEMKKILYVVNKVVLAGWLVKVGFVRGESHSDQRIRDSKP